MINKTTIKLHIETLLAVWLCVFVDNIIDIGLSRYHEEIKYCHFRALYFVRLTNSFRCCCSIRRLTINLLFGTHTRAHTHVRTHNAHYARLKTDEFISHFALFLRKTFLYHRLSTRYAAFITFGNPLFMNQSHVWRVTQSDARLSHWSMKWNCLETIANDRYFFSIGLQHQKKFCTKSMENFREVNWRPLWDRRVLANRHSWMCCPVTDEPGLPDLYMLMVASGIWTHSGRCRVTSRKRIAFRHFWLF